MQLWTTRSKLRLFRLGDGRNVEEFNRPLIDIDFAFHGNTITHRRNSRLMGFACDNVRAECADNAREIIPSIQIDDGRRNGREEGEMLIANVARLFPRELE